MGGGDNTANNSREIRKKKNCGCSIGCECDYCCVFVFTLNDLVLMLQKNRARKREQCATKIQKVARGMITRVKNAALFRQLRKRRKAKKSNQKNITKKGARQSKPRVEDSDDELDGPGLNANQSRELEEKIRRLEDIERNIAAREVKMLEAARVTEERALEMSRALKQIEDRVKQDSADQAVRQQLLMMAAGPISERSEYMTKNSARKSGRASGQASARWPEALPSARSISARKLTGQTPRIQFDGDEWIQYWDAEQNAAYWYCERTKIAKWEQPGSESYDSGYESSGALTDYSTDNYESGGEYADSEYGESDVVWQEYWDEQAQAKYWYNNNTVRWFLFLSLFFF